MKCPPQTEMRRQVTNGDLARILNGLQLHTLEGIVRADVRRVDYDDETGRFEEEVLARLVRGGAACASL
jgi:hypothetical protein